jgi:hypothetical protein
LSACDAVDKLKEDFEDLTNQFVLSGFVIGAEDFQHELIDMDLAGQMSIARGQVFLAEAQIGGNEMEPAPVTRATVVLDSSSNSELGFTEDGDGFYSVGSEDGFVYTLFESLTITADNGEAHTITVETPEAADFDVSDNHALNSEMVIDLTGQGFDSYLVAITAFPSGEVVYSNEPASFSDLYTLANGTGTEVTDVVIPGDAFAAEGIYLVALSALVSTDGVNMDNMNTALSSMLAGQIAFDVVCVPDCATVAQ